MGTKERKYTKKDGITLISLVITLLVLFILATITTTIILNPEFMNISKKVDVATISEKLREEKESYLDAKKIEFKFNPSVPPYVSAGEFEQRVGGTFRFKNNLLYYNNKKTNISKEQYENWFKLD